MNNHILCTKQRRANGLRIPNKSHSEKKSIYLGAPEAEAESLPSSRVPLSEVYEDYHGLLSDLKHEKFIVVGRKGSGKSAFAEYVYGEAQKQPNLFAQFIRNSDYTLENIVQLGVDREIPFENETLIKWIIYTNVLKMFAYNAAIRSDKSYNLLRQFLDKNSGYISIKEYEIKELVKKHGFEVNIEPLKRYAKGNLNKQVEIKSSRAPFYRLLPHLEETILRALNSRLEKDNNNSYIIFFDDLDIGFSSQNEASCDSLVSLIRVCRHINNDIFGKNNLKAKVVLLLRDDIEIYLSTRYADTAKIFSSYSSPIIWFQEEYASGTNEDELNIKKFINKRIAYAFSKAMIPFNKKDPWGSMVSFDDMGKTSFKYALNNTLFRPRDLLLLFKPLENGSFNYPLSKKDINTLVKSYSTELAKELKNELTSFFSSTQIETIFLALHELAKRNHTYDEAAKIIRECCKDVEPLQLLDYLFDRSVIGNVDSNGRLTFKCREPINTPMPTQLRRELDIAIQYGIKSYVTGRRYSQ